MRLAADDIDFQLLKISEQSHRHTFVPRVAFGLEGVAGVEFFGGFLGLANKSVAFVGAEKIVGPLASAADLRGAFNLDFPLLLNKTGAIFHVPAKCAEEGVEKIIAKAGFAVFGAFQFHKTLPKGIHQTV